jgi:NTP pyrophosphatase (non-canonical NTP hydrolase)
VRIIEEWQRVIHANNKAKGFYDGPQAENLHTKLVLAIGEISEAVEELRAGHEPTEIYYHDDSLKPEGFGIEVADCVIRLMDVCEHLGIDLERCMTLKHNYNVNRPYKHGKVF